jgi:surfactin synthase thioesterase subunit
MPPPAPDATAAAGVGMAVATLYAPSAPGDHRGLHSPTAGIGITGDRREAAPQLQRVAGRAHTTAAMDIAATQAPDAGRKAATADANGADAAPAADSARAARPTGEANGRNGGKWLIAPRPNPNAKARLFCFPYAGGGLVSFRTWPQLLDDSVEMVVVEPPGRGTRINEPPIDDLDTFIERLLPEMTAWLDRPSAFFGNCLGGLTMFATLRALPAASARFVKYCFACGVRPPHLLRRRGAFEDNLAYDLMLHQDFDSRIPPYAQTDELFADIIRRFELPAADKMLSVPKLRKALLPTIRAEFGMAYNYRHEHGELFSFPMASFVGDADPWVSARDSAAWGDLTRGAFTNHLRKGSHFLMLDDRDYILQTINKEFADHVLQ